MEEKEKGESKGTPGRGREMNLKMKKLVKREIGR